MPGELYKLSGGGNDFIARVVEDGEAEAGDLDRLLPPPRQIRDWTSRGLSIGADGFFLLARIGPGRARMIYLNADGSRASLCLNGTRCAARLAFELGWQGDAPDRLEVTTDSGVFPARRVGPTEVSLALPDLDAAPEPREPEAGGRAWPGWFVRFGVPHFVVPWKGDLADAPVATVGAALRHHEAFGSEGTNVDFACFPAPDRIEVRSYERGVEAETLACGTGIVATTAVALDHGHARLPVAIITRGGFVLRAHRDEIAGTDHADDRDAAGGWSLAGDARIVARVLPTDEATGLPERPWG